jgi:hypothetical protein
MWFQGFGGSTGEEARQALQQPEISIDFVLIDVATPGAGFELAQWARTNRPGIEVIMAGTVDSAARKAGDLCNDGPALAKPYEHKLVLDHIKRLIAARERK